MSGQAQPALLSLDELKGARERSKGALHALYRACAAVARRAAYFNRLPRDEDSDIQQEVYLEAVRSLDASQKASVALDPETFGKELKRFADKHAKALRRRYEHEAVYETQGPELEIARRRLDDEFSLSDDDKALADAAAEPLGRIMTRALNALGQRDREMLRDCYYSLLTTDELKTRYGLRSSGAVYTALSRARKALGALLLTELEHEIESVPHSTEQRALLKRVHARLRTAEPVSGEVDRVRE